MSFFIRTFIIRTLIICSFIFNTIPAHAKDDEMKSLVNQFHHEIEHSESENQNSSKLASVLSQWLENFNLVRVSMDTHRWTQMKYYQDAGKSEYIRNFPVLASFYFMSHTMEVFSGPVGVYLASNLGFSHSVQAVIGTAGAIISVPGLDPLCMLLFAVSPLRPMQRMMTGIRVVAVRVSNGVSTRFHLQELAQKILEKKDRINEIVNSSNEANVTLVYDESRDLMLRQMVVRSQENHKPYMELTFQTENNKTWVDSIKILDVEEFKKNKKSFDKILVQFNLSARYALKKIIQEKAIQHPKKTFYVEKVSVEEGQTNIQFKDYGVLLKPKLGLKSQIETMPLTCGSLFQ